MWLRNAWYVGAEAREVGRALTTRQILGDPVVFYRTEAGAVVAMEDICPHRFAPLSRGTLAGDGIKCGYHGFIFNETGACVDVPGESIPDGAPAARHYPTIETGPWVWIWMGDADRADPALIPESRWLTDPDWTATIGITHLEADYQLVADNLLDLSHETYLHSSTIGHEGIPDFPIKTEQDESELRVGRYMTDVEAPPFLDKLMGLTGKIDRWHTVHFVPPSYVWIDSGTMDAKTGHGKDMKRRGLHAITPESEKSTNYFWALTRNFALEDAELSDFFNAIGVETFDQDVGMIEAQQQNIDRNGLVPPLITAGIDEGAMKARRMVDQLIRSEQ